MFEYSEDAAELVTTLQRLARAGEIPFVYDSAMSEGATVAVMRAHDVYDVLRAAETNGNNYGIGTEVIIARLKQWDQSYGITFSGIGFDWVSVKLKRVPGDVLGLAREVYEFCPDVVDQGVGDVAALAGEIEETHTIYLWWD